MSKNLTEIRDQLLTLHKALLVYQKHVHESTIGPIANPNQYYQLVLSDPNFAWLRTLSALVISIDELLEGKEEITEGKTDQIARYTKGLLTAAGVTGSFEENYTTAIQKDFAVAVLHGKLVESL